MEDICGQGDWQSIHLTFLASVCCTVYKFVPVNIIQTLSVHFLVEL